MKKKGIASALILVYVLNFILISVSCGTKFIELDKVDVPQIEISDSKELLSSYKENSVQVAVPETLPPLRKEIEGLHYILTPYLDTNSELFIGIENRDFIKNFFLSPEGLYYSISAENWEKVVRILFAFDNKDNKSINDNVLKYSNEGKIKRQHAVAGLMNLLSLRYPIEYEAGRANLQKSSIIADLDDVEEKYQILIQNAFCLGFTDITLDNSNGSSKTFRPDEYLNRGEAISMLYRIFSNLGLPITETTEDPENIDMPNESSDLPEHSGKVHSVETMLEEYNNYINKISNKRDNSNDKLRLAMLKKTEEIIDLDYAFQINNTPLSIEKWIEILQEVFGLDPEEISTYICYETDGTIPYDIAAIAIFSNQKILGQDSLKTAKDKDIKDARAIIPQFDTARDINKFALLFSSGLLEGLYQVPGFTPQRPVSNTEILLLVKRIVEGMRLN